MILAFCRGLERLNYNGLHIAFAESIGTALVILSEGGSQLGIKRYFGENARVGKYQGKDALFIKIRNYTQTVLFLGSSKANSFEKARGMSITSVIGTEIQLAHKSFMEEMIARTLDTDPKYRRHYFDLNPTLDTHYIYKEFIDLWIKSDEEGTMIGGVNYDTVSLYENPSMTREKAEMIASQYDPTSNYYKALILGMRVNFLDLVYTLYDYNIVPRDSLLNPIEYIITADIGISSSATTFIAMGKTRDGKYAIYDEYYHRNGPQSIEGAKEYDEYAEDLIKFYNKQTQRFGVPARHVMIDKDISMLRVLTRKFREHNIPGTKLQYVIKERIEQRITQTRNLLYTGRLVIEEGLDNSKKALENSTYDQKEKDKGKMVRLDDTTKEWNEVDVIDSIEYAVSYFLTYE